MRSLTMWAIVGVLLAAGPSWGATGAFANITSQSGSVDPYRYDLTLHNTGNTNISTFWFAWDDSGLNFLPTSPDMIGYPSGWIAVPSYNYNSDAATYTYGIEWYTFSSPVGPGKSLSGFNFETSDSPDVLAAISDVPPINPGDPPFPVATSFVYVNYPPQQPGDSGFQFVVGQVPAPEPASAGVLGLGVMGVLLRRRRG